MIINDTTKRRRKTAILSTEELAEINEFLKKDFVPNLSDNAWMAVYEVYGKKNSDWSKIPHLDMLYRKHLAKYKDEENAKKNSARTLGHIIANLLRDLPEEFECKKGYKRLYRLVDESGQLGQTPIDLPELDQVNTSIIEIDIDKYQPSPSAKDNKPQSPKKYNPQSDTEKKNIGNRGEILVVKYEKDRLKKLGLDHTKVKHISENDDTAGYDIASLDDNGNPIYIEVKSTTRDVGFVEFDISQNEYSKATSENNYWIYLVFCAHTTTPKICRLHSLFSNQKIMITPASYKVRFTAKR